MRIRVLQRPSLASVDGLRLDRFKTGYVYDVSTALGCLLLCEGWAEPTMSEESDFPGPLTETNSSTTLAATPQNTEPKPHNLQREKSLHFIERLAVAADEKRGKRRRK